MHRTNDKNTGRYIKGNMKAKNKKKGKLINNVQIYVLISQRQS